MQLPLFRRAALITLIGNILLAGIKGAAAWFSRSSAIYADAANSISDVFTSVLLIYGIWFSHRPPDQGHPQGHTRFEPLAALLVTFSMGFAGYEAIRTSVTRLANPDISISVSLAALTFLVSISIKVFMVISITRTNEQLQSPGLKAAARDNLVDTITSVAAFLGVMGNIFIHPLLDPLMGILVGLWVFWNVFGMVKENLAYLTGAGADQETRNKFLNAVQEIDGVRNVHHIVVEHIGSKFLVDVHINVNGDLTLNQSHEICDHAIAVLETFDEVDRAYVHVEPLGYT